jgi:predicted DNA-binding transcriptional regulator YafY
MRRADRLFEIVQVLRRRKKARAVDIAEALEVSSRTIYRDIRDMIARGVPIDGEAGVGYILRPGFDLPPLMFNEQQIEALLLGARIVQSWADPELANAAADVIAKVREVLPEARRRHLDALTLWAPDDHHREFIRIDQAALRSAMRDQRKIRFCYRDLRERVSERVVRAARDGLLWTRLAARRLVRTAPGLPSVSAGSHVGPYGPRPAIPSGARKAGRTAFDFLKQDTERKKARFAAE